MNYRHCFSADAILAHWNWKHCHTHTFRHFFLQIFLFTFSARSRAVETWIYLALFKSTIARFHIEATALVNQRFFCGKRIVSFLGKRVFLLNPPTAGRTEQLVEFWSRSFVTGFAKEEEGKREIYCLTEWQRKRRAVWELMNLLMGKDGAWSLLSIFTGNQSVCTYVPAITACPHFSGDMYASLLCGGDYWSH